VSVKPFTDIAVAVEIVIALIWIQSAKIGILLGINTQSVIIAAIVKIAFGSGIAILCYCGSL